MPRFLVTGANGHLGRRLIRQLAGVAEIDALVRSDRARATLRANAGDLSDESITLGDPGDPRVVARLASRCDAAVHLIGTIRETAANRYVDSHERPMRALLSGIHDSNIKHIVYVSILGASADSDSRCLRARAAVEAMLHDAPVASTIIRVPMVLGEKDRASFALAKRAAAKRTLVFRADSLEQPIYAGDVVNALANALRECNPRNRTCDLAGPTSLTRRQLITEAAALLHNRVSIISLPVGIGLGIAAILELFNANPAITRDFLRILDHDDRIDSLPAAAALGITLTPLEETLRRCVVGRLAGR